MTGERALTIDSHGSTNRIVKLPHGVFEMLKVCFKYRQIVVEEASHAPPAISKHSDKGSVRRNVGERASRKQNLHSLVPWMEFLLNSVVGILCIPHLAQYRMEWWQLTMRTASKYQPSHINAAQSGQARTPARGRRQISNGFSANVAVLSNNGCAR